MRTAFYNLPDYLSTVKLENYFNEFLQQYSDEREIEDSLVELNELAERQWHTYKILSDEIKTRIEKYLVDIIDYDSLDIMDLVLDIIPKLGLERVYHSILENKEKISQPKVIKIIDEAMSEYGSTISNPYSGM